MHTGAMQTIEAYVEALAAMEAIGEEASAAEVKVFCEWFDYVAKDYPSVLKLKEALEKGYASEDGGH